MDGQRRRQTSGILIMNKQPSGYYYYCCYSEAQVEICFFTFWIQILFFFYGKGSWTWMGKAVIRRQHRHIYSNFRWVVISSCTYAVDRDGCDNTSYQIKVICSNFPLVADATRPPWSIFAFLRTVYKHTQDPAKLESTSALPTNETKTHVECQNST